MHLSVELPTPGFCSQDPDDGPLDFQVLADDSVKPLVAFGGADMSPAEARARVASLREHLARIEAQLALVESGPFAAV